MPEAFLTRLNRLCPAPVPALADFRFRLPSEAEWEYAAKGGHRTALTEAEIANPPKADECYPLYAGSDKLKEVGWYGCNSHSESKAVGLKQPNELGLYDMSGNVFEWSEDNWHSSYDNTPQDGSPWVDSRWSWRRVFRGGDCGNVPGRCRATYRNRWPPSSRYANLGFRLVFAPWFTL